MNEFPRSGLLVFPNQLKSPLMLREFRSLAVQSISLPESECYNDILSCVVFLVVEPPDVIAFS
jgi:hypothetical protein